MKNPEKIAVVTGANRGIGFEVCRQLAHRGILTILTSRDEKKGMQACHQLEKEELPVRYFQLDVDHAAGVQRLETFLAKEFGRCDILVNNAGVFWDKDASSDETPGIMNVRTDTIRKALETNLYGPILLCQALVPLMEKNQYGRIVNFSSGMGQLSEMNGGYPSYRISKTAINAVTRIFSEELQGTNILVNSVCPGWVQTDMGGPGAKLTVQEGADTAVWLATLPDEGPTGKFFRNRKEIPW